jgi:bifunctional DNase/RNase
MAIELIVHGVGRAPGSGNPLVVLRERERERYLVIGVGALELTAIAIGLQGVRPPRPMTHELLMTALEACGARVTHAVIHAVIGDIFHARLVLDIQGRHAELDSRASDAIAVALRAGIPLHAEEAVLERMGLNADPPEKGKGQSEGEGAGGERIREEQLGAFRDAIEGLNLDDLGRQDPPG